jgi:hypothetical protein
MPFVPDLFYVPSFSLLFFVATQSFGLFSLRRVLGDCVSVWFRATTQNFVMFSLRRAVAN